MFTLLFRDVEVKTNVRDDPRELEKIRQMQIDNNFDNWLSAYTIYMAVVLQAYPGGATGIGDAKRPKNGTTGKGLQPNQA
ncbi:UNVERIFIED_CONTAM: hypothetical protein K2H54_006337 [Gekko kuhli]